MSQRDEDETLMMIVKMQYQPMVLRDENGGEQSIAIPVTRHAVIERINKALASDRQQLFLDGNRVVWIDLRSAQEIDLEEYARRHGHMEQSEKMLRA